MNAVQYYKSNQIVTLIVTDLSRMTLPKLMFVPLPRYMLVRRPRHTFQRPIVNDNVAQQEWDVLITIFKGVPCFKTVGWDWVDQELL